jgi:beta-lactamase regulating signal transducer with metallopeptidase domain
MNALQFFVSQVWVERLGWTLIHFLWQGALITAAYAAAVPWMTRRLSANARYLIGCFALAAMMAAPLATYVWLHVNQTPQLSTILPTVRSLTDGPTIATSSHSATADNPGAHYLPWIVALWITGAFVFCVRLLGSWLVAAKMRSWQARVAPPDWQSHLDTLARKIRVSRPVRLMVSATVQVPTVLGALRPLVLMPIGALSGLAPDQIEGLLLHELAHIRRHDYLINIGQSIIEALLFYHPGVWWISNHVRRERELCCDDVAVSVTGDVLTYARALAELESFRPAHNTGIAANGGMLADRIARLLGAPRSLSQTVSGPGMITSAVLAASVCGVFVILFSAFAQTPASIQAQSNINLGIQAFREAKYEKAAAYFEEALRLDPRSTDAEVYLATTDAVQFVPGKKTEQNQAFAERAVQRFENVLKKNPDNAAAISGLASIYQNTDQLSRAHDYYLKLTQLKPFNAAAFYSVGALDWIIAYDKRSQKTPAEKAQYIEEGIRNLDIALAISPEYVDALTYKNLLLREKAELTSDAAEKAKLIREADDFFNRALQLRRQNAVSPSTKRPVEPVDLGLAPPPPPPPPPPPKPGTRGAAKGSDPTPNQNQQYRIGNIAIAGATAVNADVIRSTLGLVGGQVFDEDQLRAGFEALKKVYGSLGYVNFTPQPRVAFDEQRKLANLVIDIEEDRQFLVKRINVTGNMKTADEVIRREILIKEGQVFNSEAWDRSLARLNQLGYFDEINSEDAEIKPSATERTLDINLKLREK